MPQMSLILSIMAVWYEKQQAIVLTRNKAFARVNERGELALPPIR